jgi:hypothetical protein
MMNIRVHFRHLRYEFPDEQLIRYGSPYFDVKSAGADLVGFLRTGAVEISNHVSIFDARHILAANESFPESALADPLADLEVWDDWRSGLRSFPYPGTYSKLGITQQESKTSATSSVGVIGEIMAGIYAQVGISPWVLVRVIRHWPDFIFSIGGDRYAFVESKAHTGLELSSATRDIPNKLLAECLVNAIQQLNADPFVQVWGAFTYIRHIAPLDMSVTFLELDTNNGRRQALTKRILPDVVVNGLAERAINSSLSSDEPTFTKFLAGRESELSRYERKHLEAALIAAAMRELENMLLDQNLKVAVLQSRRSIESRVTKMVRRIKPNEGIKTRRLFSVLGKVERDGMQRVRSIGTGALFADKLSASDYGELTTGWSRRWETACKPWGTIGDTPLWRCGGAVLAIGAEDLLGRFARPSAS